MYKLHYKRIFSLLSILLTLSIVLSPPLSAGSLSAPQPTAARQDAQPDAADNAESKGTVTVGSRDFTEQLVLGQIIIAHLENAGYTVVDRTGLGGTNSAHDALKAGEVDIIWDYIGTILSESHGIPPGGLPADTDMALDMVTGLDARHHNLIWLEPSTFNDTYTFMVRMDNEELSSLQSLEDLATYMQSNDGLRLCVENEFYSRGDGLFNLQSHYGFEFQESNIEIVAYDQLYEGLRDGLCDVAEGFSTDGRISAWGFRNLTDSQQFFPAYNASPIIRAETLSQYPEIGDLLNRLGPLLSNETIATLNARVDLGADGLAGTGDEETPKEVALAFLRSSRLIAANPITVSSKDYTEQLVLGQILKLLLQESGYEVVDKTGLGGSRVVREAMLNGEIDVYMELTGSALAVHNGLPSGALPSDPDRAYTLAKSLDEPRGIIWLNRGEFNDTYAIMAREELTSQGIESIDDLATYMNENDSPLTICVENDFYGRPFDGLLAMQEVYGFEFKPENVILMDLDGVYSAMRDGNCDVGEGYATDGRGVAWGFTNLQDTRSFFPYYNIAPVIRKPVLDANPELADILNSFPHLLDDPTMSQLNARVDIGLDGVAASGDEETPENVARSFLEENGLLQANHEPAAAEDAANDDTNSEEASSEEASPAPAEGTDPASGDSATPEATPEATDSGSAPSDTNSTSGETGAETEAAGTQFLGSQLLRDAVALVMELGEAGQLQPPQVVVGSSDTVETQLMAQMILLMLQDVGYDAVDQTNSGDLGDIRSALEAGEIDVAVESVATALNRYHQIPLSAIPQEADRAYSLARQLDEEQGIIWLTPTMANQTHTLLVRQELAAQGIVTIEDLATYAPTSERPLTLCASGTYLVDPAIGLLNLQKIYNLNFAPENVLIIDLEEVYAAVRDSRCDLGVGFRTDARVHAWELFPLADTRGFFPASPFAPVIRRQILDNVPGLKAFLGQLGSHLDDAMLSALTARLSLGPDGQPATGDEEEAQTVANAFLCETKLLIACQSSTDTETNPLDTLTEPQAETDAAPEAPVTEEVLVNDAAVPAESSTENRTVNAVRVTIPSTVGTNARATTSTDAAISAILPRGAELFAVARTEDNSWLQVQLPDGSLAWVFTDAVIASPTEIDQLPVTQPPALGTTE